MSTTATLLGGHGIVLPIVAPLATGALLLLMERHRLRGVAAVSLAATALQWLLAWALLAQAASGDVQPYLLGNWPVPIGISLALDRLAAMMLLLTSTVALGSLLYALGGDADRGPHFHALFQFQLMGLAGAFLTADLFNLFVFFEVLLAASYGLLLHGATRERLKASVHYVVFNLTGSALFLIAVSLLYAVAGTLSMADLAVKLAQLPPQDQRLAQAAALMLLVVFGVKAALLPLYLWLPATYPAASAPVAALFAIMTKVGVYAIARTTTLMFGTEGGALAGVAQPMLPWLALATLVLGSIGALAARQLRVQVAYLVVASAGTLLLAVGLGTEAALAAGLLYLVHSTLVAAAGFLLADRIAAARGGSDAFTPQPMPRHWAPLGVAFVVVAVAVAGMPPLGGFIGKALLLQAAGTTPMAVSVVAAVLAASLVTMVALARAGSALFWRLPSPTPAPDAAHRGQAVHGVALVAMLLAIAAVAAAAGPLSAYTEAAARQLTSRQPYLDALHDASPALPAWDVRKEMRERGEAK